MYLKNSGAVIYPILARDTLDMPFKGHCWKTM